MESPIVNSFVIQPLLLRQLQTAIDLYTQRHSLTPAETQLSVGLISHTNTGLLYKSGIALKLASIWQLSAVEIATEIASYFSFPKRATQEEIFLDFRVRVTQPGFIDFQLKDLTIAIWLQRLVDTSSWLNNSLQFKTENATAQLRGKTLNLFPMQYAHARCCSLLRLAHHQGLIRLKDSSVWQVVDPNPLPWLISHPEDASSLEQRGCKSRCKDTNTLDEKGHQELRLIHPAEWHLIAQLIRGLDELSCSAEPRWVNLATDLSQAMMSFHSSCRIFGEVKTQTPQLAQARLGLVAVTRLILESLLEEGLGAFAPVEL